MGSIGAFLWFAVIPVAVFLLIIYMAAFIRRRRIIYSFPVPGPQPSTFNMLWPFGTELHIIKEQLTKDMHPGQALFELMDAFSRQYAQSGLYRMWLFFRPVIVMTRSDTAEYILKNNVETHKSEEVALIETWLGEGLLTSNGDKWRTRRKMLTPVFHFNILEDFITAMNEQAALLTDILLQKKGENIDVFDYLGKCTLNIICETAMGISINAQREESHYIRSLCLVAEGFMKRVLNPWLWSDFIYRLTPSGREYYRHLKVVHEFTREVIAARMKEMQEQPSLTKVNSESKGFKSRQPLLDTLLIKHLQDKELTIEDIREEVDTFMFTGHDTTAIGLMWALYLLGLHPEVQEKVHDELDRVFGDDRTRPVTSEDLSELKYLECVIKESLRLYPSAPVVARRILNDGNIGKYHVTAGSSVFIDIYHIHRDPKTFEDPEMFDPNRFLPQNAARLNSYAYIPFSAGPRNCVGQKFAIREEKVILSTILRRLQVKSLDPREQMRVLIEVVIRPTIPVRIAVRERPECNNDFYR